MEFLTFEDETAIYDATLFPDAYQRYCHLLGQERAYRLCGLVEQSFGTFTITLREITMLT